MKYPWMCKTGNAVKTHCKVKGTPKQGIPTKGGYQEVVLINEPNVYRLIVKSKLPSAEKIVEIYNLYSSIFRYC